MLLKFIFSMYLRHHHDQTKNCLGVLFLSYPFSVPLAIKSLSPSLIVPYKIIYRILLYLIFRQIAHLRLFDPKVFLFSYGLVFDNMMAIFNLFWISFCIYHRYRILVLFLVKPQYRDGIWIFYEKY